MDPSRRLSPLFTLAAIPLVGLVLGCGGGGGGSGGSGAEGSADDPVDLPGVNDDDPAGTPDGDQGDGGNGTPGDEPGDDQGDDQGGDQGGDDGDDLAPLSLEGEALSVDGDGSSDYAFSFPGGNTIAIESVDPELPGSGTGTFTYTPLGGGIADVDFTVSSGDLAGVSGMLTLAFASSDAGTFSGVIGTVSDPRGISGTFDLD